MKRKTKFILFIGLVGFFYTCTKEDFEGPSINNLYGNFEIVEPLTLTSDNPNFASNEEVGFHCTLNKPVAWKIAIHGLTTSASREITGFSSQIDSNTVVWNGGPSQAPFFSEESCSVELSFENEIDTLRDTSIMLQRKPMRMVSGSKTLRMEFRLRALSITILMVEE